MRPRAHFLPFVAVFLSTGLLSGCAEPRPASVAAVPAVQAQTVGGANPAVEVYRQAGPSVVNVTSLAVVRTTLGQSAQPQGAGSGFILDADGRIATNNHVVADAQQLAVTLQDGTTVPATLLGRDADNDLAVIQVDPNATDQDGRPVRDRLRPVTLADSNQVTIGEAAIAIGSPLGLQQSVSQGIVSALRDPGEGSAAAGGDLELLGGAIQTDAAINPGNSGGPLFNAAAQVIGVNTAILSQSGGNEGIGFAIPSNVLQRVVPQLVRNGRYRHPQLGVTALSLAQMGAAVKQQLGLAATQRGLLVQQVTDGAQQAGLQAGAQTASLGGAQVRVGGDVIVAIDGQPVTTVGELRGYIENNKNPGDTVSVRVVRNGQSVDVALTLNERPQDAQG